MPPLMDVRALSELLADEANLRCKLRRFVDPADRSRKLIWLAQVTDFETEDLLDAGTSILVSAERVYAVLHCFFYVSHLLRARLYVVRQRRACHSLSLILHLVVLRVQLTGSQCPRSANGCGNR